MSNETKFLNKHNTSCLAATSERTALHMATLAAETKQDGHSGGEEEEEISELRRFVLKRGQTPKSIIAGHFGELCRRRQGGRT